MQHVPVKNTSAIDFTEPLKTYIKDNYSKTEFAEVGPAITDVQRMRDMVVRAVAANSIGECTLSMTSCYLKQDNDREHDRRRDFACNN